jgi:hypothetical protein
VLRGKASASRLQVDGWAEFRAPARIGVLVRELRAGVAMLLGRKVLDTDICQLSRLDCHLPSQQHRYMLPRA